MMWSAAPGPRCHRVDEELSKMITVRKIALPLALALVSASCMAGPGDTADSAPASTADAAPVGETREAWGGWGPGWGGAGWAGPLLGGPLWRGPWPGWPYVCDGTGACFSPLEGDYPWL
jgi:hypothetical protein